MELDLSLIEIAGEDDSLLDDTVAIATTTNNYRSCSPLQIPKPSADPTPVSLAKVLKYSVDLVKPSCSSPKGSSNKENINLNKSEVSKLSIEPLQMKRRKKGGGYDLRKSLAWDRAFFTDEGVLNPHELSMISGTSGNSYVEPLSVVNEEGRSSFSGDSNCTTNSVYPQTFEGTFKGFPDTTLNEDRMKGGCLIPKHDSSSHDRVAQTSVATRKVLSIHGGSRSASKGGGCPRPVASYSLKMPENVNSGKAAKKESKLPKIPVSKPGVSKPGPCSLSTITRSTVLSASHLKHNQIAQPVVNGLKSVGLKNSQNFKSAQNKAKPGPDCLPSPAKFSAQHYKRNLANSQLEAHSLNNPRTPLVSKANRGLEVIRGPIAPSTKLHSSAGQDRSTILAAPFSQKPHIIGGNMQHTETQTVKPSGLRMPSPSLRFFGQPKASGLQTLSQKNTQPYNFLESSILGQRKVSGLRPPHAPGKVPKIVNDVTTVNAVALSSSTQCSALPANSLSRKIMKLDLEVNNVQKVEVKFPYVGKSSDSESSSCKHEVHDIIDSGQKIQEHIVFKEDAELHMTNNQVLLQSGPGEDKKATIVSAASKDYSRNDLGNPQFIVGSTGTKGTVEHQHEEVISTSQSGDSISYGEQNSSTAYDDRVRCMQDTDKSSGEQTKLRKSCTNKADQVSFGDIHSLKRKHGAGKLFGESQKYEIESKPNVDLKASEHSGNELKNVYFPFQHEHREQDSEAASGLDNLTNKAHVGDAKLQAPSKIFSVANCNSNPSASAEHNQFLKVGDLSEQSGEKVDHSSEQSGEHLEPHSLCLSIDQSCQYNADLHSDDYLLLAKRSFSEKSQGEEVIESVQCVPERSDVSISALNGSDVIITHVPGRMQDGGVDIDKMAEKPPVEGQLHSVEIAPSVGIHKCSIDTHVRHDIKLIGEATFTDFDESLGMELGLLVQSSQTTLYGSNLESIGVDGKGKRIEISGGSLFGESVAAVEESQKHYLENITDASPIVRGHAGSEQAHDGAGDVDNMNNKSHVGDAQVQLLDGNVLVGQCNRHISAVHNQYLNIAEYNEQLGERPELPNSCLVVEQVSEDDHQLHLSDYSFRQKNTKEFKQENILVSVADAVPEQGDVCASDTISSNAIAQVPPAVKETGFVLDNMDDQPHLEDAPSASVGTESSAKYHEYFIERQFRPDMESTGQPIPSAFESALKRSKYQNTGVITTCSEELGLLVKGDQSSSRSSQVDIGVDELMRIFPDETENKIFNSKLHHEVDNSRCLAKDKDAIAPVSESSMKQDNLMVKPPPNAIPFSDEWLAAIEAAGEDILTMKSGAVTNSPPDKSLPEPGPWSPVKRKNNQIGPFDCTKFTNTLPFDSH